MINVPREIGDKYTMDRFNNESAWKQINTATGFSVVGYETTNKKYDSLAELLNVHGESLFNLNMKHCSSDMNYRLDEIVVHNKEHNGYISIRDCVKI